MKKIAVTAMLLLIVCFSIFAQDAAETNSAAQEIAPSADISSDELNSTANNQIEVITEKDRLVTMVIEFVGGLILFKIPIPHIITKAGLTVIVIILNFFISKFFAFKTKKKEEVEEE